MDEVRLDRATVHILPVVRGLPSESETVRQAIESTRPSAIGLSIGPEELESLRAYGGGPLEPENFEEEIYGAGLAGPGPRRRRGRASPRGAGGAEPLASGDEARSVLHAATIEDGRSPSRS